jgi:hypothetical protein
MMTTELALSPRREMQVIKTTVVLVLAFASFVGAQTKPTQAEINQWKKESNILESSVCKKIIWLLDDERTASAELPKQPIRHALGWWGRGFIEGAVYMIDDDKAQKKAGEFGLSVDVVAAHVAAYCYEHQTETPLDAVHQLLLKVLK